MIRPGNTAPNFDTLDIKGKTTSLSNFEGKYLLISFMRGVACPSCHLRHMDLDHLKKQMNKAGLANYLIYHSSAEELMKNLDTMPPESCKMIPDPDLKLHQLYDIRVSYMGTLMTFFRLGAIYRAIRKRVFSFSTMTAPPVIPADFLVDRSGQVIKSHYGRDYMDNIDLNTVLKIIRELKK